MDKRFNLFKEEGKVYADAVSHGDTLYLSGVAPLDENGNLVGFGDIEKQTEKVFLNMREILSAHEIDFDKVLKITVYLRNMEERSKVAKVRRRFFTEKVPASTILEVSKLGRHDMLIEIEAIAALK